LANQCTKFEIYTLSHSRDILHTHTQPFYGSLDFVRDNSSEPVPEKNIHPFTPIMVISHPLSASSIHYDPWHPTCSILFLAVFTTICLQVFFGHWLFLTQHVMMGSYSNQNSSLSWAKVKIKPVSK